MFGLATTTSKARNYYGGREIIISWYISIPATVRIYIIFMVLKSITFEKTI